MKTCKQYGQELPRAVTEPTAISIPVDCISPDPHQPRKNFTRASIEELLKSIQSEQLQQYPHVNPAKIRNGKPHYYMKAGERRWRAHLLGKIPEMMCIILPEEYQGVYDVKRDLAQASENSCREPHTHAEIVGLMHRVVSAEVEERGTVHGAVAFAVKRIASTFGKSEAWARNYQALTRLAPELLALLDHPDEEKRLGFQIACKLVVAPQERQMQVYEHALKIRDTRGGIAMLKFIATEARAYRKAQGEVVRGTKPSDAKRTFERLINSLSRTADNFSGGLHSSEYNKKLDDLIKSLSIIEVDIYHGKLKLSLVLFQDILRRLDERHVTYHKHLSKR